MVVANNPAGAGMKICFLGLDNLPALAQEFGHLGVGGEQVQQALLAKALVSRGHSASMIVLDYGQNSITNYHGVTVFKTFRPSAGLPVLRFVYPRWVKIWSAMSAADADVYYVSCAGMHLGLAAIFCKRHNRKLVFRVAHDHDCEPEFLLVKYRRDKLLYEFGVRHANAILVQTAKQQIRLNRNYHRIGKIAGMLVERPLAMPPRTVDVLWVNNIRPFKRPDIFLELARSMPDLRFQMVGGPQPGHEALFDAIQKKALLIPNLEFCGHVPYHSMDSYYSSARIFVNTSESEGFPNSYLQSWVRGTPVIAFFDPDAIIERFLLGQVVASIDSMRVAVRSMISDNFLRDDYGKKCLSYMEDHYSEQAVAALYIDQFEELLR